MSETKPAAPDAAVPAEAQEEIIARWCVRSGESGRVETPKHAKVWRLTITGPREGLAKVTFEGTDESCVVPAGQTWVLEPEGWCECQSITFESTSAYAVEYRIT